MYSITSLFVVDLFLFHSCAANSLSSFSLFGFTVLALLEFLKLHQSSVLFCNLSNQNKSTVRFYLVVLGVSTSLLHSLQFMGGFSCGIFFFRLKRLTFFVSVQLYWTWFNSTLFSLFHWLHIWGIIQFFLPCFQAWSRHKRGSWSWWPTPTCTGTPSTQTSSWSKPWCFCRSWRASLRGPRAPWRPVRRPPTRRPSPSSCVLTSTRCPTPVGLSHFPSINVSVS